MATATSFPRFSALPPELRLQIWEAALSAPAVWIAGWGEATESSSAADSATSASRRSLAMTPVGAAPYLAGLASRESRRVMERMFSRPIRGRDGSATNGAPYWMGLDTTLIYLGVTAAAASGLVLEFFDMGELSGFKHVGLPYDHFGSVARTCQRLAALCPGLQTLVVRPISPTKHQQPPSLETAADDAAIARHTGPEPECGEIDVLYLRTLLLEYFGDSPPQLHVLSFGCRCAARSSKSRPFLAPHASTPMARITM